jgi:GST-like protein
MIEFYTWSTPNGRKVSIMLEECGLPYRAHAINIGQGEQFKPEFLAINPNSKIPAIVDPEGPDGQPIALMESGAILVYLAGKTGKFLPQAVRGRYDTLQWLMFQMGGVGPMFGQLGFFKKFAGKDWEDKRPLQRYVDETRRLLGVMDAALDGRQWFLGDDYTIADIAMIGWVRALVTFYDAQEITGFDGFRNVSGWLERALARPAVQRGLTIPATPST